MPGLVVVTYDVTSEQSFNSCVKWLERVRAQKPAGEIQLPGIYHTSLLCLNKEESLSLAGVLVACKCDLSVRRKISEERGKELAESKDLEYFETSAVSNNN